jgi:hypothetical protein
MKNNNYNCAFAVKHVVKEVFDCICRVKDWWAIDIDGDSDKLNDVFTIHFGDTYVTFKITEMIANNKIVWHVTDCFLPWLNDKTEWTNTEVVYDITESIDGVTISMTHVGLIPGIECYDGCKKGWDFYAGESLRKLITEGKGEPNTNKSERVVSTH